MASEDPKTDYPKTVPEPDPKLSTTEARQGDHRRMSLRVLIIALVVVVLAFGAIWWFFLASPPGAPVS